MPGEDSKAICILPAAAADE